MTYPLALLIFFGSALMAVGGLFLARRFLDLEKLRLSHEVTGYFIAIGGTLYAVLLGLIVVDAMAQGQKASEVIGLETNNLADVYVLAANLPKAKREKIRTLCKEYAEQVPTVEWQLLRSADSCPLARSMALDLMNELMNFEPKTENDKALYPQMNQEASAFWQNRQTRLRYAEKGIPNLELIALVTGAVLLVGWTYLFDLKHVRLQVMMTAMIAMIISLNFILLFLFAYPFRGDFSIKSDSFESLQSVFTQADKYTDP